MCVAFVNAKTTHIFTAKNISVYAIFNDQCFNDTLTNDIVHFEQPGPGFNFLFNVIQLGTRRLTLPDKVILFSYNTPFCNQTLNSTFMIFSDISPKLSNGIIPKTAKKKKKKKKKQRSHRFVSLH